jgi:hypothetical protein
MPSVCRSLRARQTTVTVGCWANQVATVAAERSDSKSTTRGVARSTRMVPYDGPLPGPFVDTDNIEGWGTGPQRRTYQAQEGSWTGR